MNGQPQGGSHDRSGVRHPIVITIASIGCLLILVNLGGFVVPLRSSEINGYVDFAGSATLRFEDALAQLTELAGGPATSTELAARATEIFHHGIAHVSPQDVQNKGLEHYRMRVPITENWLLFLMSFLKPDTYRDYEFCSYRKALERGTGRCGQQALALVSFLADRGVETGVVSLGGHAVATAKVTDEQWYLLDADYGAVIPFDLATAESDPGAVANYYWSAVARENNIQEVYAAPMNSVRLGGPEARFARACPFETFAYQAKWILPVGLILAALSITLVRRSTTGRS